jgi:type I restriction enzyme R subunit
VKHKLGGRAKAMVVTSSRLAAVRYRLSFDRYLAEKGYTDIGVLMAFSGDVVDEDIPGEKFSEPGMNKGIGERELPDRFASPGFHFLIVANKYQTGFDQPLLTRCTWTSGCRESRPYRPFRGSTGPTRARPTPSSSTS